VGGDREVMAWTEALLARGLYVQGIRPPTVPVGTARLRVGLTAAHSVQQLDFLANSIDDVARHRS
jgi:8-amino-7-oxononanoate synthase